MLPGRLTRMPIGRWSISSSLADSRHIFNFVLRHQQGPPGGIGRSSSTPPRRCVPICWPWQRPAIFTCARSFKASAHRAIGDVRSFNRCSTVRAPWMKSFAEVTISVLRYADQLGFATCRDLSWHKPKPCRRDRVPLAKLAPSPTAATRALAMVGPIPGMSINRRI
jgi:hypothetical protein